MARMKVSKNTNRYPDVFMIKAVQLTDHPDIPTKAVAKNFGLHPVWLYHWRKEYREGAFKPDT